MVGEFRRAVIGGTLIDGTGRSPIKRSVILIKGAVIEKVGEEGEVKIPSDAQIFDAGDRTIIPGLIDCHLHLMGMRHPNLILGAFEPLPLRALRAAFDVKKVLMAGFTTVRDAGSRVGVYLKRAVEEGIIIGPRILSAGLAITKTGGHADQHFMPLSWFKEAGDFGTVADGIDKCMEAVRLQVREGADVIKICASGRIISKESKSLAKAVKGSIHFTKPIPEYTMDELMAMVGEAHMAGKKVMVHAIEPEGIKNALIAGADTIEHGVMLDEEACKIMVEKKAFYVPTLCLYYRMMKGASNESIDEIKEAYDTHIKSFRLARKLGVKIAVGTDTFIHALTPFGENAEELELMVKAGMTPMEAISAATKTSAEALGLDNEIGTIEEGKLADLLVIRGDPLMDIGILRDPESIEAIFIGGAVLHNFPT
jgi:imidazolonepropionase-like amidohydrolase